MCSRYTLTSRPDLVREYFGYNRQPNFPPRYNIAPTQPVPIVRAGLDGVREFALVRWGLIPSWVKDPREFSTLINARAETISEKPSFKAGFRYRRCLFPADGFYEWAGKKGAKHAYFIHPAKTGPIAFAGIWEHWMGSEGSELESAAIITTEANTKVSYVHGRMPVILAQEHFSQWLECRGTDLRDVQSLLHPAPEDMLKIVEISAAVNNPRNDMPEVQEPV